MLIKKLCDLHPQIFLILVRPIPPVPALVQRKFIRNPKQVQLLPQHRHLRGRHLKIKISVKTDSFWRILVHVDDWARNVVKFGAFGIQTWTY